MHGLKATGNSFTDYNMINNILEDIYAVKL